MTRDIVSRLICTPVTEQTDRQRRECGFLPSYEVIVQHLNIPASGGHRQSVPSGGRLPFGENAEDCSTSQRRILIHRIAQVKCEVLGEAL